MYKNKSVGQITIRHIGDKFVVCISGNPQDLYNSIEMAKDAVKKLRKKYGRTRYVPKKKRRSKCKK